MVPRGWAEIDYRLAQGDLAAALDGARQVLECELTADPRYVLNVASRGEAAAVARRLHLFDGADAARQYP